LDRGKENQCLANQGETEAIVVDGTAKTASEAAIRLEPAEKRLLAGMPLHAITSVHGEAGLRERLAQLSSESDGEERVAVSPDEPDRAGELAEPAGRVQ